MEVIYYVASSLDGFIATSAGGVDWLDPFNAPGEDHGYAAFEASIDVVLMGRRTYDVSKALGGFQQLKKPCWVFSHRPIPSEEPMVSRTAAAPAPFLDSLGGGHARAWLMGGGELASSFQRAGLITEYRIFVAPVMLGSGIALFGDAGGAGTVQLVEARAYDTGMVELQYKK